MTTDGRTDAPTLTIGVPTYNSERYLAETLDAIRKQEFTDFEVLISDNASSDRTPEIAQEYCDLDPRFRLIRQDVNIGSPRNYNALLAEARGRYFTWNASDDRARPAHARKCIEALECHPSIEAAFSRVVYIDESGMLIGEMDDEGLDFESRSPSERTKLFLERSVFQAIGFGGIIRTAHLKDLGGIPVCHSNDLEIGVKMTLAAPWTQVDDQLYETRRHATQGSKLRTAPLREMYSFVDPSSIKRFGFPEWDLTWRMLRAAAQAPIERTERLRASVSIVTLWSAPNWRLFLFDFKRNLRELLSHGSSST